MSVYFVCSESQHTHLFDLLAQGSTVALSETGRISLGRPHVQRIHAGIALLTVPYLPVTPTLRVRFVCKTISNDLEGSHSPDLSPWLALRVSRYDMSEEVAERNG